MKSLVVTILVLSTFSALAEKNIMLVKLEETVAIAEVFNQLMIDSKVFVEQKLEKKKFEEFLKTDESLNILRTYSRGKFEYILEPNLDVSSHLNFNILVIKVYAFSASSLDEIQPEYFKFVGKKGSSEARFRQWLDEILDEIRFLKRSPIAKFKGSAAFFSSVMDNQQFISEIHRKKFRAEIGRQINNDHTLLSKEVFIEYLNDSHEFVEYQIMIINSVNEDCRERDCVSVIANITVQGQARDCSPLKVFNRTSDDVSEYLAELERIYSELNTPQ
ncbi:MAG: hypothetical protein JXR03_00355 [Cyclobacteriaceae bacterium]